MLNSEVEIQQLSKLFALILNLVNSGDLRISEHGYDELVEDGLTVEEIIHGTSDAKLIEEYPEFPKGACVLLLQRDALGDPIHVVWGIPKGYKRPVVLVTAYRPDKKKWSADFLMRRKS